ncbi:MAG: hypothetical protein HeimC3_46010 [Candidatus Heimdallarchaeota archaeon LC_3]|nr:MAG: hypothetical protein HeimC3_46010 [Candidatus Heimdallarchaeota archaeon LC_3]
MGLLLSENQFNTEEIKKIESLTGKTLLVYWTLLKGGSHLGVREIQRILDFSSPSVASYHLEKLKELDLVDKDMIGAYIVKRKANIAELKDIVVFKLANRVILLPRYIFYAVFSTIIFIGYFIFFFPKVITTEFLFLTIIGSFSTIAFWYETYRIYNSNPFT